MDEPAAVKIARIEEGMVRLHGKLDYYHQDVRDLIKASREVEKSVDVLKRDRYWLFTLCGFGFTSGVLALVEMIKK